MIGCWKCWGKKTTFYWSFVGRRSKKKKILSWICWGWACGEEVSLERERSSIQLISYIKWRRKLGLRRAGSFSHRAATSTSPSKPIKSRIVPSAFLISPLSNPKEHPLYARPAVLKNKNHSISAESASKPIISTLTSTFIRNTKKRQRDWSSSTAEKWTKALSRFPRQREFRHLSKMLRRSRRSRHCSVLRS